MKNYLEYSPDVQLALEQQKPILALESTIITHGMPFPHNLATAKAVQQIAREQGVTPATIAIMNGKIKIGLTETELETLANDKQALKVSTRDLPFMLNEKKNAGTTVAATLFAAHAAGIKVFATGGIGGVHRGDAMDISADLLELAKTPIAVICAGVKAILDLPRTMELLETLSIPVIGYGTDYLPAFYTSTSQYKLPMRVNTVPALADLMKTHWVLGLNTGVLITNPVPSEHEIPADIIEKAIKSALIQSHQQNISGKNITPFLLNEVSKVTEGKSLATNILLIKNNVALGATLAKELHQDLNVGLVVNS